MHQVKENKGFRINGFIMIFGVVAVLLALAIWLLVYGVQNQVAAAGVGGILAIVLAGVLCGGFFTVQPNQARVLVFFGRYTGTVREEGFGWTNPFAMKKKVSLRVRNLNTKTLKVNEATGNPIEIAAVVVWRVVDSAKALFDVDRYADFVDIQSETAVRALANRYPYDPTVETDKSLRGTPDAIAEELRGELEARLQIAGVTVMEARLTHLAYAAEIAQAMLRRQQAQAVVAARRLIVEAAVGMVQQALETLSRDKIVELDEDRKAAMVNNMMVVLTSEHGASPVVNTGTLYT